MTQSARWIESSEYERPAVRVSRRLSFLRFFLRYPIFLLAFGPPQFKRAIVGVDTSQAHLDIWNVLQAGWLAAVALRAILRLLTARRILIPGQIRSVLLLTSFIGLAFLASVIYSPGRVISAEFSVLYFLTLVCVVEFVVDVYQDPPNWMQCIFQLRLILLLLFVVVLFCIPFEASLVLSLVPGAGIRLMGGSVAPVTVICPIIVIVSAYSFLHSLESRVRSMLFFLVGLGGILVTQTRGAEVSVLLVLLAIAVGWGKMSKRSAYVLIAGLTASMLLAGVVVGSIGGGRIWNTFNRGEDTANLLSGSGRTVVWVEVIRYCLTHPQGMGYIAGIRQTHRVGAGTSMHDLLTRIGGVDSSYIQVLGDAGWLALGLYLMVTAKTLALGWRFSQKPALAAGATDVATRHALRCMLALLMFCLLEGMVSSDFAIPLRQPFYLQFILISMILGVSGNMLFASRNRSMSLAR